MASWSLRSLFLALLLLTATPALAKDVCVASTFHYFVLKDAKVPRKPGAVVPLLGYLIEGGHFYPFEGSAVAGLDGVSIRFGFYVHGLGLPRDADMTVTGLGNGSLTGPIDVDTDADGEVDIESSLEIVTCGDAG